MLAQEIKELSEAKTEKRTTQEIQNFEDVKLSNVFLDDLNPEEFLYIKKFSKTSFGFN